MAGIFLGGMVTGCQDANPAACGPYWANIPYSAVNISPDPPSIRLVEVWRAGGSAEGEEIAQPASVSASSRGAVAVVDFGLGQVNVISSRGEWLGSWSRRGKGPSELTMPVASTWAGDTLVVFDVDQAKVVRYVAAATAVEARIPTEFVAPVAMTGSIEFVAVTSDGSVLLQQPLAALASPDSSVLSILMQTPGAAAADTVVSATVRHVEWDRGRMAQPGTAAPVIAVGANGWVAQAASDGSYRIAWGDRDRRMQLCAPVSALPLTSEERGVEDGSQDFEDVVEAIGQTPPPTDLNAVGRVVVSSDGDLWVDRRRPRPLSREKLFGSPGGTMDIFSSSGDYLGRVIIPDRVSIQAVSDSMAVGIQFSELDEATIVAYRLAR